MRQQVVWRKKLIGHLPLKSIKVCTESEFMMFTILQEIL